MTIQLSSIGDRKTYLCQGDISTGSTRRSSNSDCSDRQAMGARKFGGDLPKILANVDSPVSLMLLRSIHASCVSGKLNGLLI